MQSNVSTIHREGKEERVKVNRWGRGIINLYPWWKYFS
jgi:hypothetical protein